MNTAKGSYVSNLAVHISINVTLLSCFVDACLIVIAVLLSVPHLLNMFLQEILLMCRLCLVDPLQYSLRMTQPQLQLQHQPSQTPWSRCRPQYQSCSSNFRLWPRHKRLWQDAYLTSSQQNRSRVTVLAQRARQSQDHNQKLKLLRARARAGYHLCLPFREPHSMPSSNSMHMTLTSDDA